MLLVDDDQAEVGHRGEDRRAGPDADIGLAGAQPPPLVVALPGPQRRVKDRDPVAEPGAEPGDGLRREPDLGNQDDRPPPPLQGRLGGGQVDLGLAGAGDAVQQQLRRGTRFRRPALPRPAPPPSAARRSARRALRSHRPCARWGAAAAPTLRVTIRPRCSSRRRAARSAPRLRGDLRRPQLAAAQRLQRGALARAQPLAALRGGQAGVGGARPQLQAGAHTPPASPGPGRQHQREPARGGRAILARDPEAQPDQLRRRPGLERLERLGEPLRRQLGTLGEVDDHTQQAPAPERDPQHGPDPDVAERPRAAGSRRVPAGRGRWSAVRPSQSSVQPKRGHGRTRSWSICLPRVPEPRCRRTGDLRGPPVLAGDPRLLL